MACAVASANPRGAPPPRLQSRDASSYAYIHHYLEFLYYDCKQVKGVGSGICRLDWACCFVLTRTFPRERHREQLRRWKGRRRTGDAGD